MSAHRASTVRIEARARSLLPRASILIGLLIGLLAVCIGIVHVTVPRCVGDAFWTFCVLVIGVPFVGVNVNVRLSAVGMNIFVLPTTCAGVNAPFPLTTTLTVWSKHLSWLPSGHQQLLFIEDAAGHSLREDTLEVGSLEPMRIWSRVQLDTIRVAVLCTGNRRGVGVGEETHSNVAVMKPMRDFVQKFMVREKIPTLV